jgi:hypothetical protein
MDELIYFGDAVKALDDQGKVGGYLVRFTDAAQKDLVGDYFTKDTYFGARDGDGCDALFHHGIPVRKGLEELADHVFAPLKTTKDEVGIFAETVLDQSDKYEAKVLELVQAGKIGWSSGSSSHLVKREKDGRLKRWIISEGSLTHMPCDPMNRAVAVKSLAAIEYAALESLAAESVKGLFQEKLSEQTPSTWQLQNILNEVARDVARANAAASITGTTVDVESLVLAAASEYVNAFVPLAVAQINDWDGEGEFYLKSKFDEFTASDSTLVSDSDLEAHSAAVVSALTEYAQKSAALAEPLQVWLARVRDKQEFRTKAGRVISAANRDKIAGVLDQLGAITQTIKDLQSSLSDLHAMAEPNKSADPDVLRGLVASFDLQRRTIHAARR